MNKSKSTLSSSRTTTKRERIVVVGAGLAGLRSAERLRELGFTGELVMIGAERRRPYHRPALSKQLLTGELRPKDLTLRSYVPLDAIWRRGTQVIKLDTRRHIVELPGDEEMRYDGLVIATGVEPRHLAGAPRHDPRVHMLRTMGDAIGLQRGIATGNGRVVVIGGGFTACEVASTARELGCEVTILSRSKVLLGKAVGNEIGEQIAELQRANGVQVELGVNVTHWLTQPWGITMQLDNGKTVSAGTVVLAVGSTPSVQWLRGSGLTLEDGILCRPSCHVVGANDVVAAGDVARWPNLKFDATPRRIEHWMHAVDMGRAASESLLAGATAAKPFTPLPRFWSEMHGLHIQAAGIPSMSQDTLPLARRPNGKGITGYVRNGRLIGVVGLDDPRGMIRWTEELKRELRRPETVTMPAITVETAEPAVEVAAAEPEAKLPAGHFFQPRQEDSFQPIEELFLEPEAMLNRAKPMIRFEPVDHTESMARPDAVGRTQSMPRSEADDRTTSMPRPPEVVRPAMAMLPPPFTRRVPPQTPAELTSEIPLGPEQVQWSEMDPSLEFTMEHPTMGHFFEELPAMLDGRMPPPPPSRSGLRPVPRPMHDERPPHPSMPNMRPVARPMPEDWSDHPSRPGMRPVARPMQEPMYDEPIYDDRPPHPSMPNMQPVARPMTDAERRREQELLEWQFARDERDQLRTR